MYPRGGVGPSGPAARQHAQRGLGESRDPEGCQLTNVVVPKTRILTGPGVLYKAPLGTLLPGQTSYTVTNKALTSNVATITTSASHTMLVGDQVVVSIGDTVFDGLYTITAVASSTFSYARSNANVTSGAATGSAITWNAGGTVSGSKFTDSWPSGWVPIGVTKEGNEFSYAPSTGNIEVAEFLLPLQIITTGVEIKWKFDIAEFTAKNYAFATNGGATRTVSGTGATLLTELTPPVVGSEVRQMIGWESDDNTERLAAMQVFQTGTVAEAHKKGTDNATIAVEFGLEQPSVGYPFRKFYAGSTPVGS